MDAVKLRAWWAHRQGLDGCLAGAAPPDVLKRAGWARSVGGANPYLTLFSRAGVAKKAAEEAAANLQIHELPSARGCTYQLPAEDFALGLFLGHSESGDLATAKKFLGVTDEEIERLSERVLSALGDGSKDPRALKEAVGDAARNLGEEGKKRGVTTTLPPVLGKLQSAGKIRRVPLGGRLDTQKFSYVLWSPSPFDRFSMSREEANAELARKYFKWTGPATPAQFQWFSGLGVGATEAALEPLGLVDVGDGLLMHKGVVAAFEAFQTPKEPQISLVASIDSLFLLRRDLASAIDAADAQREVLGEKGMRNVGGLQDLPSHGIVDRGRLVGLWEYDTTNGEIAWISWVDKSAPVKEAIAKMETFVRDELGDARSFSLDSPESRASRVAALRG